VFVGSAGQITKKVLAEIFHEEALVLQDTKDHNIIQAGWITKNNHHNTIRAIQ